ncbi:MAG TPA: hypothetical protein VFJ43_18425, partial [Bacteroidia bacterium]|nr:hypothetical protein [Bacteroidia bacterium]
FLSLATEQSEKGIENHHIEINLREAGATEEFVVIIIRQLKNLHYLRRKKRGFKLVLWGSVLLVFGCVITLFLFHSGNSINYAMYGLTTAGILFLLWGMIDIMGW